MSRSSSNSSPPHTPSSVVTAVKATQRSPFFHARLQRGLRIDSPVSSDDSSFTSSHAARLQLAEAVLLSTGSYSAEQIISAPNGCDEKTQEARGYPTASFIAAEKSPFGQGHASTTSRLPLLVHPSRLSAKSRPLPASSSSQLQTAQMPMPAADQDFWASIADAPSQATPTSRRYHYLTRSQSTGAFQQSPKMRKKNASYNAAFDGPQYQVTPSPLRAEYDLQEQDIADSGSSGTWLPAHRHLSPIDEGQFFPDKRGSPTQASGVHGDAISMHSTTSAQTNLFINRPVRRTASTSTFGSTNSVTPRMSPEEPTGSYSNGPSRSYNRSFSALPVIPASPRESQNVYEPEPMDAVLKFPLPVVYPPPIEYSPFADPDEEGIEEPRLSMAHSKTPSVLTRSESVRTELTYLTADGSEPSRRSRPDGAARVAGRRSVVIESGVAEHDHSEKLGMAARVKASIETLMSKSSKPASATKPNKPASARSKAAREFFSNARSPWAIQGKPSEVLFWTGFIAPWCWLIGGWMLSRSGQTKAPGLRSGAREGPILPIHREPERQQEKPTADSQRQQQPQEQEPNTKARRKGKGVHTFLEHAKNSSAELLTSLRSHGAQQENASRLRPLHLRGDVMTDTRLDRWVIRCRVAAVVSGMFILALLIVALIVLARAL